MQWSLEDIYKKQVRGNVPPRKHLRVLGEAEGEQMATTRVVNRKTGDKEEIAVTSKEQEAGKFDLESTPTLGLTDQDIELFNMLGYDDQVKVKKYIESHALREIVTNTLKGSEDDVKHALRLLMSSDLSADQIENVMQLINEDKAVNVQALQTVGNKPWNQVFESEAVWEMFKDLIQVGVGKAQKGPGEVALTFLDSRIELSTKGDIAIAGELYELKLNGGRISDVAAPSRKIIQPIIDRYLGEFGVLTQKTMKLEEFVNRVNQHKKANRETEAFPKDHYVSLAKEVFTHMLDEPSAVELSKRFAADNINPQEVMKDYKRLSFEWYKGSKVGEGKWNKLIGINFKKGKGGGSVATVETGEQFANIPISAPQVNVIRSASGTREGYVDFYPIA